MAEDQEKLVVYKRFATTSEALVVQSLLSSIDIYTEVINEGTSDLFPSSPSEAFQPGLLVRKDDIDKIEEVLKARFSEADMSDTYR